MLLPILFLQMRFSDAALATTYGVIMTFITVRIFPWFENVVEKE